MKKHITAIFFGKSGSGKGTQAQLLMKYLADKDPQNGIVYVETGDKLRSFVKESASHTAEMIKDVMSEGGLVPASMPIWAWSSILIDNVKTGNEHMVFDGVARRVDESPILVQALQFYGRKDIAIIFLDVPHEEVTLRLIKRGRHDDHHEKIQERLKWFETDVMQSVKYFKSHTHCTYLHIDGHQPIEKVHHDILKALGI